MNEDLETPTYSFWPLLLAVGILLIAVGIVWTIGITILGLVITFASIVGWVWENRIDPIPDEEGEDD
jgi:hypothetical protein